MKTYLRLAASAASLSIAAIFLCGCASTHKTDLSSLQGSWVGKEVNGPSGENRMVVSGNSLKFQGARAEEWYEAKLNLIPGTEPKQVDVLIQNCPSPQYVGKTAKGIYRLENNSLTIAASEPGNQSRPSAFEGAGANEARVFVFRR